MQKIPLKAKINTVRVSTGEKAITRVLQTTVDSAPSNDGEHDLLSDSFLGLYKSGAQVIDDAPPERKVNQAIMDWTLCDKDFKESVQSTAGNIPASLAASSLLWESLRTDDSIQNALNRQRQADDLEKRAKKEEQEAAETLQSAPEDQLGQEMVSNAATQKFENAEQIRQMATEVAREAVEGIEKIRQDPVKGQVVASAVYEAGQAANKVNAFMRGWGIDPGLTTELDDISEILEMANDSDFSMLALQLGRAKGIAKQTIRDCKRSKFGPAAKVENTKDVSHIFPHEIALMHPSVHVAVRAKRIQRFASDGLPGWQPLESSVIGGNFAAYVDDSGSMGWGQGSNAVAAKGVAMGVAKATMEDLKDRSYELYTFESDVDDDHHVTDKDDWKAHCKWASYSRGGGTNFDAVLTHAIARIKEWSHGDKAIDIMMISDGICNPSPQVMDAFEKTKKESGARLMYVQLGRYNNERMQSLADAFIAFDSGITNPAELTAQLSRMIAEHAFSGWK